MSDESVSLPVRGRPAIHLSTRSGHVSIAAEERADLLIERGAPSADKIEFDESGVASFMSARWGSSHVELRCPVGTDVVVGTASGHVRLQGSLGRVRVTTMSGFVEVEKAQSLDVRSLSGRIEVKSCAGRCRVQTKSGHAEVGSADDAELSTFSGHVRLGWGAGNIRVKAVSGQVEIGTLGGGDVAVQTLSGSVRITVPDGVRPSVRLHSLSGRPHCECPRGDDFRISVTSMSGKIEVMPGQ